MHNGQQTMNGGPLNLIIEFTTSTHCENLRFLEFESFQIIISFTGV
jgi:hypothetical protein